MADIVWSDVSGLPGAPPGFATFNMVGQVMVLQRANNEWDVDNFDGEDGELTKTIRVLTAAHLAALLLRGPLAVGGPVTSESEGDLSTSYAFIPLPLNAAFWSTTTYGLMVWQMIETSPARVGYVTG